MMQNAKYAAGLVLIVVLIVAPIGRAAEDDAEAAGKVVVFRLAGELREAPPQFTLGFEEEKPNLYELLQRMSKAKKDSKVKAVVLLFDNPTVGWAQRQELRQAIHDLRAADKDVYCVAEEEDGSTYMMAAAASRIYITPTGGINLIGLHIEQAYFKGLMDKIGLSADIEHIGAYKGAGEPFTRTGPSDQAKEMLDWLVNDLFDQMVQEIAEDRQLQPEQVKQLINQGPFNAQEAKKAKLVDEIGYPGDLVKSLKERYGENIELVHDYGEAKLPEIDLSSPFGLLKFFGELMAKAKAGTRPKIAVVYADGMIVTGKTGDDFFGGEGLVGSTNMRRLLARIRDDDEVKAVVLRVNSPGGSAVASDIIWHATQEVTDKPFIVSMGDVAASGGYYISVGASRIYADPGTITGSIGVVGGKIITQGLWNWLGVNFYETYRGENADLYNTNRPFTEQQREIVRKYMRDVYQAFKERVEQGRKDRLKEKLDALAGGRVYTGRQAQAKGLVDKLGGVQDAIKYAAAEANVSNYEVVELPAPKNFFELLVKNLSGEEADENHDSIQMAQYGWLLKLPPVNELLRTLGKVDPPRARMVIGMLRRLELLGRENALLVMPEPILVR